MAKIGRDLFDKRGQDRADSSVEDIPWYDDEGDQFIRGKHGDGIVNDTFG